MSEEARRQLRNLVAQLSRLGSRVVWDGDDRVRSIAMFGKDVQDRHLSDLRALPGLMELNLTKSRITDAGLFYVGKLVGLETLMLGGTVVTDEGLEQLRHLTRLKSLNLIRTGVTDTGLDYFCDASDIETLWLERTDITDAGLPALRSFSRLALLDIGRTFVSDGGLVHVGQLLHLEELNLSGCAEITGSGFELLTGLGRLNTLWADGCPVTDDSFRHLVSLPLRLLSLNWTSVTDAGLRLIEQIGSLSELHLMGTKVSAAAIARLRQALPQCTIHFLHCPDVLQSRTTP